MRAVNASQHSMHAQGASRRGLRIHARLWHKGRHTSLHWPSRGHSRTARLRMNTTSTAPDPIAALLHGIADGQRDALEKLYRDTSATLLGICIKLLRDREEAEDVLQEVFVTVWSKANQFDSARARGMTWLGSIARNRSIDRLRARPQATWVDIDDSPGLADEGMGPVGHAAQAQDRSRLDDCFGELDDNRQQLIRTAFFEGATYEELAQRNDSPLGTVKSWIRRGLQQLKACLER